MPATSLLTERHRRHENDTSGPNAVLENLRRKQAIIDELIAGRLELFEAAARFAPAHRASAACIENAIGVRSGIADDERLCRTVIGWVHLTLSHRPEEAERISARLEQQLQSQIDQCGQVSLSHH